MSNSLRLLPSLRPTPASATSTPDDTPTVPAIPRARTVTLDDLEDSPVLDDTVETPAEYARGREIDRILVSYLLDLDRTV